MSDTSKAPKRSAEEIEADLARTRAELTDTVNILSERLSPKTQIENAKQTAKAAAGDLNEKAMAFADTAAGKASEFAETASVKAKDVIEEAAEGDPKAIAIIGGAVAGAVLLVTALIRRRS